MCASLPHRAKNLVNGSTCIALVHIPRAARCQTFAEVGNGIDGGTGCGKLLILGKSSNSPHTDQTALVARLSTAGSRNRRRYNPISFRRLQMQPRLTYQLVQKEVTAIGV